MGVAPARFDISLVPVKFVWCRKNCKAFRSSQMACIYFSLGAYWIFFCIICPIYLIFLHSASSVFPKEFWYML